MGIIPISSEKRISEKDDDGNVFHFRYITGQHQDRYNELQQMFIRAAKPFAEKARREINKSFKGNKPKTFVVEDMVAKKAIQLADEAGKITPKMESEYTRGMVDLFLCGWDGENFPEFPKNPSECFRTADLERLMVMINKNLGELTGLTIDDKKN